MFSHSFRLKFKAQLPANRLRSERWQEHLGVATAAPGDPSEIPPTDGSARSRFIVNMVNAGLARSVKLRQMPRLRMALDMIMVNAACCSGDVAWFNVLQSVLPLSDAVFVAGSAATWLAEHCIARLRPLWDPTEIYVFVMVPTAVDFQYVVDSVLQRFQSDWLRCATPIRFRVMPAIASERQIKVQWWLTVAGTEYPCPDFCFMHSTASSERVVLQGFEIDICRVSLGIFCEVMCLRMCPAVFQHIKEGRMHCSLRSRPDGRCAERIARFTSRGYQLSQLTLAACEGKDDFIVHAVV